MKKYSELLFSLLLLFLVINIAGAQSQQTTNTTTTDPNTGVRVTTMVKPLPTLIEQVRDFEIKLANAERDPKQVENGTVDKYKLVLIQLRKDLEIENLERKRLESLEKK